MLFGPRRLKQSARLWHIIFLNETTLSFISLVYVKFSFLSLIYNSLLQMPYFKQPIFTFVLCSLSSDFHSFVTETGSKCQWSRCKALVLEMPSLLLQFFWGLVLAANLTHSRIIWEEHLNEGLSSSGWPVGMFVRGLSWFLNWEWKIMGGTHARVGSWTVLNVDRAVKTEKHTHIHFSALDCRSDWLLPVPSLTPCSNHL